MIVVPADISAPLLLLSRAVLSSSEIAAARRLCQEVSDWGLFISIAARKFSLPFVYRNLMIVFPEGAPDIDFEAIRLAVLPIKMMSLKVLAAQIQFHKTCIQPVDCEHVYLKGPSLAARYHDDSGLRFSRDIDVLVPKHALEPVVRAGISNGYRVLVDPSKGKSVNCDRDLRALLRYEIVISMMSPDNVVIEVHREVDKNLGVFKPRDVLKGAEEIFLEGLPLNVMPTSQLFCYICYHNSRHTWSRLHWLADLDAVMQHPTFNLQEVLEYATRIGIRPVVDACIEFNNLSKKPSPNRPTSGSQSHAEELLESCIVNLSGDLAVERQVRSTRKRAGLNSGWFLDAGAKRHSYLRILARFSPSFYQYLCWPLPDKLQWLYYLTKPYFALRMRISERKS